MNDEVMPGSFYSRERLGLLFALAVVLLIASLSYRTWAAFGRSTGELDGTEGTVSGINALLLEVRNAETGQRGFLLTGEAIYLKPYHEAQVEIPAIFTSLEKLTLPRPDQANRVKSLNILVNKKLEELELTIKLRRKEGFAVALAVVRTDQGRELTGRIWALCTEILNVTNAQLSEYSRQSRFRAKEGVWISIVGGSGLFLLLLVAAIAIQRGTDRRQSLIGDLQRGEGRLESAAADAEAANRAKSTFLSTMSHEIRTPMNAILGYAQLMLRDPSLGTDAKANLKIIGRSGEHLLALINDVLDMSKIEAGRTELNPVTFDLFRMLDDLAAMFRLRAESKALVFEMLCGGEAVLYVIADESKIRQVLINLLGNAVKFTQLGHIRMHVSLEQKPGGQLWLSARVEDSGPGLTDDEQKRLFEPFSQTSRGVHSQEGTGLGLAISRKYARLMGGDITVTSRPGEGSEFRFETPIQRGDAGVAVKRAAPRRVSGLRPGTIAPTVLVVDDHVENRDWLIKLLTCIGFSVRGAENGEAAIRCWEEWGPRLILMDVHMPVMDGLEATRRIKADPRGKETIIVTLTASALTEDRRAITRSGADDFLAKPCLEDELLEKVRLHLHVDYDYEDARGTEGEVSTASAAPIAETLRQLPRDLLEQLQDATSTGDKRRLDRLIVQVRETENSGTAHALQELADTYQYDALTRWLEEANGVPSLQAVPVLQDSRTG